MPRRMHVSCLRVSLLLLASGLASCTETGDYLSVAGGGFVFNYRIAEATYGVALKPMRELPEAGVIEATFENPSGGTPFVIRKEGPFNPTRIAFTTPPVQGVAKGQPYEVKVVLKDEAGATLQTIEKSYVSELDQSVIPARPLVIGPGYQENIDASETAYPPSLIVPPPAQAR